jgi:hypothetical protein
MAQSAGRIASARIIPGILIIQNAYGLTAVFLAIAAALVIAAVAVTQEVAPPTG